MVTKVNLKRTTPRHLRMTPFEQALERASRGTNGMLPAPMVVPVYVQTFSRIYHQEVGR